MQTENKQYQEYRNKSQRPRVNKKTNKQTKTPTSKTILTSRVRLVYILCHSMQTENMQCLAYGLDYRIQKRPFYSFQRMIE